MHHIGRVHQSLNSYNQQICNPLPLSCTSLVHLSYTSKIKVIKASQIRSMRRRRGGPADGDELQESLLGESQPSSAPMQPSPHHQQIIKYQPFSVEAFIQWVLQSWMAFLSTLSSCLQGLLRGGGSTTLSLVQAQRLEELQESLAVPYDGENLQHQQQLQELWSLAFPQLPFPTSIKSNQWKEMGWQSDDPGRDFRGAGLYGLDNLIYMGTHHPRLFKQLMLKTQGQRAEWEYPFAVAGLNLTFQLAEVLGVHNNPGELPKTAAGRAFCELLRDSEVAFEELYCTTFALLDRIWLQRKASYMEFNIVMADVKGHLDRALRRRPKTLAELQQRLHSSL